MKVVSKISYYDLLIIVLRASINITHYLFMNKVYHLVGLEEINSLIELRITSRGIIWFNGT